MITSAATAVKGRTRFKSYLPSAGAVSRSGRVAAGTRGCFGGRFGTGPPIGAGLAFVRYLLNIVNALPCYLGYLWPLWDSHRQTFADKIMSTYVIKAETPQPRAY